MTLDSEQSDLKMVPYKGFEKRRNKAGSATTRAPMRAPERRRVGLGNLAACDVQAGVGVGWGKTFAIDQVAKAWKSITGRLLQGDGQGDWAINVHPSTTGSLAPASSACPTAISAASSSAPASTPLTSAPVSPGRV